MREPTFRRPQSFYETVRTIYFHHFSWSHKCILCKHYTTFELSLIYSTLYMAFPRQPLLFTVPHNAYETVEGNLVFLAPIGKTRWPPWPLIGWDIFDFSSETAERNSTKLDRKQDLNVLYLVCVFGADRKNKLAALTPDWLRHFRLLWNCWTEFKETWQEARSQHLLPSFCFSGRWVNKNFRPGWSVKKVAHCTQVHDMWPFGPLVN